ncbi:OmpL47-type beta-barrel domain-containing protein [[Clostridium] fimetarium]|uniref:Ig-like domain-containing protein n=1 Tax=[Clostridium] fimetarium TaxID=99656 RepID=A0A1I0RQB6_9FIRM|nr:Ig-like domain-containing protein [[Clostridium] fimetarium]SEW42916.1 hypothetical protein SAMN05421659_1201 [[Clostridium] fimetarium]
MKKKRAILATIALVIFVSSNSYLEKTVKAETDTSRFGEVLVSDSGTDPTIQNGNTTRKLAVASDGTIYATYHCTEGIRVAKSLDQGNTFQSSILAYNKNLEAEIAVSTDGSVYLAWVEDSNIKLSKSTDGGLTFQTPIVVGTSNSPTVHMATDGNYIYIIDRAGLVLHRSSDAGETFSSVTLATGMYVFSDVHVDPTSHTVIVQEDNPSLKYYISTNYGVSFGDAVMLSEQKVYFSVGSIGSDLAGKYLLIAGASTTGVKINLDNGAVTNPVMGNNITSQGRSLSDDVYGNMATGYSDNTNVYLQVSHDLGSTFGTPITVAQATIANASINTTNGDILFLYERAGKIYLKVYGNLLKGYDLNVSNSSLYFNADNNDVSKDVTITNTSDQPLDINSIIVLGDFTIDSSGVNSTLAANESAVIHVNYKHSIIGTTTGKISINYGSNSDVKYINLTGYVTKALPVTPILSGPSDISINNGESAIFSVSASITDNGTLSYQWQNLSDNGTSWNNVTTGAGATTNSYTTGILTATDNGTKYRCVVANTVDGVVSSTTSSVASLTINNETQPIINVTGIPTDWKNSTNLEIDATAGYSGIKSVTVNGTDITDSYKTGYTVTESGSYTFVVTSNSGLTASQTVSIANIDSTAPNKPVITKLDEYTDKNWYNTDQTITAGFTPTQGSSEKVQYSLDGGNTWADGTSIVVSKEGINTVLFRVIDELGNASNPQSVTVQIDKTNPSLSLSDVSGWSSSNVSIAVTADDALSGVKEVTYTTDEAVPQTGTVVLINGIGTIILTNEGQYKVIVTANDKAGNTIEQSKEVKIDKTAPSINVTGVPTDWKNNANLSVAATAGISGIKSVTVNGTDITSNYKTGYTVTESGNYTFVVTSNSGLTALQTVTIANIDSTAPNKPVITKADEYTDNNWYNTDQTITAGFTPTQGSPEKVQYSLDGGNIWADGTSIVASKEGINTVLFRVIDDLGNASDPQSIKVQIDKINPSLSLSDVSGWSSSNVRIDVTADDALSGVKEVTYTTDEAVPQTGTVVLINGIGTITLTNEGQYKIIVTANDKAGNTIEQSEEVKIDKTALSINVTGVPTDWKNNANLSVAATAGISGIKSVTVNGTDITDSYKNGYTVAESGSYTFVVTSNSGLTTSQTVTIANIDSTAPNKPVITKADEYTDNNWYNTDQTITAGFTPTQGSTEKIQYSLDGGNTWADGTSIVASKEGINTILFRVIDELGNASNPQSVTVQIDKTNPLLSLSDVSGWNSSNVNIDVTANDVLLGVKEVTYTTDEAVPQTGTVILINGVGTITFTKEGQYKVIVTAKDKAGNIVTQYEGIKIDKTKPVIPVLNSVVDSHSTKITGTAEPGSKVTVKDSKEKIIGDGIANADGSFSITIIKQTDESVLYVIATDTSGNVSDKSTIQVVTLTSHVADMIDVLPNPNAASDDEILNSQNKITETKLSYDALDQDGRDLISYDRKEKLDNLISRLKTLLVIIAKDKTTGIMVEGIGTAVVVDELNSPDVSKIEISLNVKPIVTSNNTTMSANIAIATTNLQTSGQEILAAFDISLMKSIYGMSGNLDSSSKVNNSSIVDYITVRIPVPDNYLGRNDLSVIFIDDSGNVHPYDTKIVTKDGIQYVEFQTNHFSEYAIVGNSQFKVIVETGDTNPIGILIVLLGISGIILLTLRKRIAY